MYGFSSKIIISLKSISDLVGTWTIIQFLDGTQRVKLRYIANNQPPVCLVMRGRSTNHLRSYPPVIQHRYRENGAPVRQRSVGEHKSYNYGLWMFMVLITIVPGVYTPTNITGGENGSFIQDLLKLVICPQNFIAILFCSTREYTDLKDSLKLG